MVDITVLVRTRDEERRIGKFCEAYKDATRILVADGGSVDRTKDIAVQYPNVHLRDYGGRVHFPNGMWRNNDSDHANWLIQWSKEYDTDWVIYDDCDCRPNHLLKQDYHKILAETDADFVLVTRLFVWEDTKHFTYLAKPNQRDYEPSLWAWRANQDFWTVNVPPAYSFRIGDRHIKDLHTDANALDLFPPYCLLHFSWNDKELMEKKLQIYRQTIIPGQKHPLDYGSPLEDLPSWAHE